MLVEQKLLSGTYLFGSKDMMISPHYFSQRKAFNTTAERKMAKENATFVQGSCLNFFKCKQIFDVLLQENFIVAGRVCFCDVTGVSVIQIAQPLGPTRWYWKSARRSSVRAGTLNKAKMDRTGGGGHVNSLCTRSGLLIGLGPCCWPPEVLIILLPELLCHFLLPVGHWAPQFLPWTRTDLLKPQLSRRACLSVSLSKYSQEGPSSL